jgi:hypothetical protein
VAALVADALACVAAEHAPAHAGLVGALGARRVELLVAGERIAIALGAAPPAGAPVVIRTSIATLAALVEGERGLLAAILADELEVIGAPDDLVAVGEAMGQFLAGALRCPAMPVLRGRLAALTEERSWTRAHDVNAQ